MPDRQITTWLSKQLLFDKTTLTQIATDDETEYFVVCLSPLSVAYLLQLATFYADWPDRFPDFTQRERDDLIATTVKGLVSPLACSEDIADIISQLQTMNTNLAAIATTVGEIHDDFETDLLAIESALQDIKTSIDSAFPSNIFDEVETILAGTATILGATVTTPSP